ncbi:hypothetical protein B0T10DRAFT_482340 [Thelonectria olida]|uniref:Secreted protein n=1 Tax=Thelonectria olida TaxID=1576542 RepID=A0A9P8W906_9HYPO|nr:hypothetical protein B0T10DRAFT_482340 [Thelonectria olida]
MTAAKLLGIKRWKLILFWELAFSHPYQLTMACHSVLFWPVATATRDARHRGDASMQCQVTRRICVSKEAVTPD